MFIARPGNLYVVTKMMKRLQVVTDKVEDGCNRWRTGLLDANVHLNGFCFDPLLLITVTDMWSCRSLSIPIDLSRQPILERTIQRFCIDEDHVCHSCVQAESTLGLRKDFIWQGKETAGKS